MAALEGAPGAGQTEHIDQMKEAIATLLAQVHCLATKTLGEPVLAQIVPGKFGDGFRPLIETITIFVQTISSSVDTLGRSSSGMMPVSHQMASSPSIRFSCTRTNDADHRDYDIEHYARQPTGPSSSASLPHSRWLTMTRCLQTPIKGRFHARHCHASHRTRTETRDDYPQPDKRVPHSNE